MDVHEQFYPQQQRYKAARFRPRNPFRASCHSLRVFSGFDSQRKRLFVFAAFVVRSRKREESCALVLAGSA